MFAKDIEWLVNHCYLSFQGMAWLRKQYQSYLVRQGFFKIISRSRFTFNSQKFVSHILEFYGIDFLENINPLLIKKPETYLTNCLLGCDVNPLIDRVMHLLLIKFLTGSIKDFFSSSV